MPTSFALGGLTPAPHILRLGAKRSEAEAAFKRLARGQCFTADLSKQLTLGRFGGEEASLETGVGQAPIAFYLDRELYYKAIFLYVGPWADA